MVGESDAAIDQIEAVLAAPGELSVPLLRIDPIYDPLRDHPRFQALLDKYGSEH
jgi:serine/threonine-protein kinase